MTNEQVQREFQIVSRFSAGHYLDFDPDEWAPQELYPTPPPSMVRTRRDVVLEAVDTTRWRTRNDVCELTGYEANDVSQILSQFRAAGKVDRRRTRDGVYVFKRTEER